MKKLLLILLVILCSSIVLGANSGEAELVIDTNKDSSVSVYVLGNSPDLESATFVEVTYDPAVLSIAEKDVTLPLGWSALPKNPITIANGKVSYGAIKGLFEDLNEKNKEFVMGSFIFSYLKEGPSKIDLKVSSVTGIKTFKGVTVEKPKAPPVATCKDEDGDGFDNCKIGDAGDDKKVLDCKDTKGNTGGVDNGLIFPTATELCDGVDNNCDTKVDENACTTVTNCGSFGNTCKSTEKCDAGKCVDDPTKPIPLTSCKDKDWETGKTYEITKDITLTEDEARCINVNREVTIKCNGGMIKGPGEFKLNSVGIYVGDGGANTIIEGCTVENFGKGIVVDDKANGVTLKNNVATKYGTDGITIIADNALVDGNKACDVHIVQGAATKRAFYCSGKQVSGQIENNFNNAVECSDNAVLVEACGAETQQKIEDLETDLLIKKLKAIFSDGKCDDIDAYYCQDKFEGKNKFIQLPAVAKALKEFFG